jgi:hypothetical protein
MNISVLGIDFAKQVFQLHSVDEQGQAVLRKKLTPWGQNTHAAMRISARTGRQPLWRSHSP